MRMRLTSGLRASLLPTADWILMPQRLGEYGLQRLHDGGAAVVGWYDDGDHGERMKDEL